MEQIFQVGPMAWVYTALIGALIWGIWGRSEDDIMF